MTRHFRLELNIGAEAPLQKIMEDKRGEDGDILSEADPRELYPVKEEEKINCENTRACLSEWFPIWATTATNNLHTYSYIHSLQDRHFILRLKITITNQLNFMFEFLPVQLYIIINLNYQLHQKSNNSMQRRSEIKSSLDTRAMGICWGNPNFENVTQHPSKKYENTDCLVDHG